VAEASGLNKKTDENQIPRPSKVLRSQARSHHFRLMASCTLIKVDLSPRFSVFLFSPLASATGAAADQSFGA
jgi:hypothetical protein